MEQGAGNVCSCQGLQLVLGPVSISEQQAISVPADRALAQRPVSSGQHPHPLQCWDGKAEQLHAMWLRELDEISGL